MTAATEEQRQHTAARTWGTVAVAAIAAAGVVIGLLAFTLIVLGESWEYTQDSCLNTYGSGSADVTLLPPRLTCTSGGGQSQGVPLDWMISLAVVAVAWGATAWGGLKIVRRPGRRTRAMRGAAAVIAGTAVGAIAFGAVCVVGNALYVDRIGEATYVSFSVWPLIVGGMGLAAGAAVAARFAGGRGWLAGPAAGWMAWVAMEFSGIAYPLQPVDPVGAGVAAVVGTALGVWAKRRASRKAPEASSSPAPSAERPSPASPAPG